MVFWTAWLSIATTASRIPGLAVKLTMTVVNDMKWAS